MDVGTGRVAATRANCTIEGKIDFNAIKSVKFQSQIGRYNDDIIPSQAVYKGEDFQFGVDVQQGISSRTIERGDVIKCFKILLYDPHCDSS
jgi:hypothetical protein